MLPFLTIKDDEVSGGTDSWLHLWLPAERLGPKLQASFESSTSHPALPRQSVFSQCSEFNSHLPPGYHQRPWPSKIVNYDYSVQFSAPLSVSSHHPLLSRSAENLLRSAQMCSRTHAFISGPAVLGTKQLLLKCIPDQ